MSYQKRIWTNSPDETVTYEDFNRIEEGIEANDQAIANLDVSEQVEDGINTHNTSESSHQDIRNKINDCLRKRNIPTGVTAIKDLPAGVYTGFNAHELFTDYPSAMMTPCVFANIQVAYSNTADNTFQTKTAIITAVDGTASIQKIIIGSMIGSMGNFKWKDVSFSSQLLTTDIDKAKENGFYTTYPTSTTGNTPFNYANIISIKGQDTSYSSELAMAYAGEAGLKFRIMSDNTPTVWQQVGTTTKGQFNCTPQTGITFHNMDCYTLNGEFVISLIISLTNGSNFSGNIVATMPFLPKYLYTGSAMGRTDLASSGWTEPVNAYVDTSGNIVVCTGSTTVKQVSLTIKGGYNI